MKCRRDININKVTILNHLLRGSDQSINHTTKSYLKK